MANYEKSNDLLKRAIEVTPLGAQTYSKSYRYYCQGDSPAFIERGEGCYLYDVDGKVVFGEITFYPWSGYEKFTPSEFDVQLGSYFTEYGNTNN